MKTNKKKILSISASIFELFVELYCIYYAHITDNVLLSILILISLILNFILLTTKRNKE